jgi:hypothetical protein
LKIDFHKIADIFGSLNECRGKGFKKGVRFLSKGVKDVDEVSD